MMSSSLRSVSRTPILRPRAGKAAERLCGHCSHVRGQEFESPHLHHVGAGLSHACDRETPFAMRYIQAMIATVAVPDNSAYSMPTWAIIIACVWAAVVIVLHVYAFVKAQHDNKARATRGSGRPHTTAHA